MGGWIIGGALLSRGYTRDAAGRITAIADGDPQKSETYGYSNVGRLAAATGPCSYAYDGVDICAAQEMNGNPSSERARRRQCQ